LGIRILSILVTSLLLIPFFISFENVYAQDSSDIMDNFGMVAAIIFGVFSASLAYFFRKREAKLNHQLQLQKTNFDKKTEYEYDARKRIYLECAPLMFQLINVSENALFKISDIVYQSGKLTDKGQPSLIAPGKKFGDEGYNFYKSSSFYKLFAPIASFKLLNDKLSKEDLDMDPRMMIQFEVGKYIFFSFSGDRAIAKLLGDENYESRVDENPNVRQGIWGAEIEKLCAYFIEHGQKETRLKRYDEFDKDYKKWKLGESVSDLASSTFEILEKLFYQFNIDRNNMILWRILIDQTRMYISLIKHVEDEMIQQLKRNLKSTLTGKQEKGNQEPKMILARILTNYDDELKEYLDWRTMNIPTKQLREYQEEEFFEKPLEDLNELLRRRFEKFSLRFDPKSILEAK